MKIELPELSLVAMIGISGSGKSTFARRHFKPTEVLSSDFCRGLVADDETDQSASADAFDVLHHITGKRLAAGRLTVVDATHLTPESRQPIVQLARNHHVLPVAIVLAVDKKVAIARTRERADRDFGADVVRRQHSRLRRTLRSLKREGFRRIFILETQEQTEAAEVVRVPLWNDRRGDHGPFDLIGDIHGCHTELVELLERMGYDCSGGAVTPPAGRKAVFVGDLVDRGPASPAVLRLVMGMVAAGSALCVPGNHEAKLLKSLRGKQVKATHGLAQTLEQLAAEPAEFLEQVAEFINGLVSHYVLDDGKLVVAHAGLAEQLQGRASGAVRQFCLYGETTGETDDYGLPVRYDWAADYRGRAMVVYGHTPVPEAEWVNRTLCIDTGCVFGGRLTALRYPELELVGVDAHQTYYEPVRPLAASAPAADRAAGLLDLGDVSGRRTVHTRTVPAVTLREENTAAALEVMSRFAVDPRWLVYLPPTMSPVETCAAGAYLERPEEAFAYFAAEGVDRVICEEKHMGSRAVLVVCRDADAARRHFGAPGGRDGAIYTRTGRPFFRRGGAQDLEVELLERVRAALTAAGWWSRFESEWFCLDAELMPWSLKASELLHDQYAAVGAAAGEAMATAVAQLEKATLAGRGDAALLARFQGRQDDVAAYARAWRRYVWPVDGLAGVKLAPFHLLASTGRVHDDQPHDWHMRTLAELSAADPELLVATAYRVVDLADDGARAACTRWWEELTAAGGEGLVLKPLEWTRRGRRGFVQPAVKCRGREYLRIIYGPEYTAPANLERLRRRGLGAKRSMALREYALGLEGLHRLVEGQPLHRVHECVFGVLALESEPVDPRL